MRVTILSGLLLASAACTEPDPFQGDEPDFLDDSVFGEATPEPANDVDEARGFFSVADFEATCDPEVSDLPLHLEAVGGTGDIQVTHTGVDTHCGAELGAGAWTSEGAPTRIEAGYYDSAAEVDSSCYCAWTLSYRILDVPTGDYELAIGEETVAVTVAGAR